MEIVPNSAIGTFNYAHSFWGAGRALLSMDWEKSETHPDSPIEFLHWHAIELFLKAYLLADGLSEDELRRKPFGHNVQALATEAVKRGLQLTAKDRSLVSFMPNTDAMIELRYLKVGVKTVPVIEEIEATCKSLYRLVAEALRSHGIHVRYYPEEGKD